jgi:hypothetical protein
MPFVSDDELFGGGAAAKPASNFVSDDELFGDNAGAKPAGRQYTAKTEVGQFFQDVGNNALDLVKDTAKSAGAVVDWASNALVADPLAFGMKAGIAARGQSDRATNLQVATEASQAATEWARNPVQKVTNFFFPDEDLNESAAGKAMGKLSELIAKGGENVEQLTGGKILKEDVEYLSEAGMLGLQAMGARHAQKRIEARYDQKRGGSYAMPEQPDAPQTGPSVRAEDPNYFQEYNNVKAKENDLSRSDARMNAEQTAYDLMQRGASKAEVERIVRRNPLVGDAMDAILSRRKMAQDSFENGPLQGEVLDPEVPSTAPRMPQDLPALPRPGTSVVEVARKGDGFDRQQLTMLGLGATGLGLALLYPADDEEKAAALATAGILYVGKNKGLTFEKLANYTGDAPLGHLLNNSEYTTKVLDRLPRNKKLFKKEEILQQIKRADVTEAEKTLFKNALDAIGKDVFSASDLMLGVKEFAEQHEFSRRETMEYADYGLGNIDRAVPYEEWDLMPGETGTPVEGSTSATTTTYTNPKVNLSPELAHFESDVIGHTRSFIEDGIPHVVEVQSDFFQKAPMLEGKALEKAKGDYVEFTDLLAEARRLSSGLYRGENWAAQSYSDFIDKLRAFADAKGKEYKDLQAFNSENKYVSSPHNFLQAAISVLRDTSMELDSAILGSPKNLRFKPLAKHWPKRLVREELAKAAEPKPNPEFVRLRDEAKNELRNARHLEKYVAEFDSELSSSARQAYKQQVDALYAEAKKYAQQAAQHSPTLPFPDSVRFATADTVAKVEGWPAVSWAEEVRLEQANYDRLAAPDRIDGNVTHREHPVVVEAKRRLEEAKANLEKFGDKPVFKDPAHQGLYDRHRREVDAFTKKLGGAEVTDKYGHTWIEVPTSQHRGPPSMYGKADVRMLAELGIGAGIGYMLADSDSQYIGAALGAAAAMAAPVLAKKLSDRSAIVKDLTANTAKAGGELVQGLDKALGAISTRIGNISQPLLRRARNYERNVLERTHKYLTATDAFAEELRKVPKSIAGELNRAILTNDAARIGQLMQNYPRLTQEWNKVRGILDTMGKELQRYGRIDGMRDNYFPRIVKDVEGLMNHFGKEVRGQLEERLLETQKRLVARRGYGLTDIERSALINSFLQGREAMGRKQGFSKERKIGEITPELEPFYATPIQSLHSYINSAVKDIEKAKFFGRNLKQISDGGGRTVDLDASIGELIQELNKRGEVSLKQAEELADMLKARFQEGEKAPHGMVTDLKNIAYMGLLGNAVSAASQLGDVATAVYMHGLRPATAAVVRRLTRRGEVDMRNYGLEDHIAEEFVNTRLTAKALNGIFKAAGFTMVDKFGKNVALEAGRLKYMERLKTASGKAEFQRKYGKMFEGDTAQVMADLAAGKLTDLAREVHFTELSDMQPITKLEMPQMYLENPNGRFLYMLRTFMLKQADIVRRDGYNEIKAGNVRKGVGNLLRFGVALGVGGATADMVKDWIMGREVDFDAKDIPLNVMKTFMWTQYMSDKGEKDGMLKSFVENSLMPPYKAFNTVGLYLQEAKTEKEADKRLRDAVKLIPIVGKLYESHAMGGKEKAAETKARLEKGADKKALEAEARRQKGGPLSDDDLKEIRRQYRLQGVGQ